MTMALRDEIRHQAALAGRVIEASAKQPIQGARVQLIAAPAGFMTLLALRQKQFGGAWDSMDVRPDRTTTAPDGHFHFLDLPDGDYTLTALLPSGGTRYGTVQVNSTVKRDSAGNLKPVIFDLALPSTNLQGKVTAQTGGGPVELAAVRVQGSGETTYTSADGTFRIVALEKGSRTVSVSAAGFQTASQVVVFAQPGDAQVLNFVLTAV